MQYARGYSTDKPFLAQDASRCRRRQQAAHAPRSYAQQFYEVASPRNPDVQTTVSLIVQERSASGLGEHLGGWNSPLIYTDKHDSAEL
jgi:hypothetical protein